ncbi:MAG: ABC transporter permease [Eubacterium sp.]|nr:ABC transporter permease [Eubacterium sp.]
MKTLVKMSMKLLVRTKIIWLFLVLMPVLSTRILKTNVAYTSFQDDIESLVDIDDADTKVAYYSSNGEYVVKVYDASGSELSDYLVDRLANSGMFVLCRVDLSGKDIDDKFITEHLDLDGHEDRMGASLYIPEDFDEKILDGNVAEALTMYVLSDDARNDALESELALQLSRLETTSIYAANEGDIVEILEKVDDMSPEKEVISVSGSEERSLTMAQVNQKANLGYAFSFLTLGFVFAGFFIANGAIQEQKNGVITRINLTKTNMLCYFTSKFVAAFLICLVMTGVVGICSLTLDMNDLGMNLFVFLFLIFLMGLIFCTLSMFMGIIMNDVFGASVASFTLWCTSSLFSGLYFPLDTASKGIQVLSSLMPQKWFMDGAEMIFVGDNKAFSMVICITVAYIAIIVSLGSVGLKVRRSKEWGVS